MTDAPDGAAPTVKDRPLTLGGKVYTLRFSFIGFAALKERWKIDDDAPALKRMAKQNITDVPAQVWACLQTHHPDVTYEAVQRILDDVGTEEAAAAYRVTQEALAAGWGKPEKKPPGVKAA